MKDIAISITDYKTRDYMFYDINNLSDYLDSIKEFINDFSSVNGGFKVQIMEHDYLGELKDNDLDYFLVLCEEFKEVEPQEIIYLLMFNSFMEVRRILSKGVFYVVIEEDSKEKAFIRYLEEVSLLMGSDYLSDNMNYDEVIKLYEGVGLVIREVTKGKYLIIDDRE